MNSTPGTEIIEVASGIYARLHENLTNAGIIVGDEGVLIIAVSYTHLTLPTILLV